MLYGFLNVNKPKWKTSFDVIRDLRYVTKIKKMGHTGTLDPLAEGVLVIAIGEATKMIEFLMSDDKEYSAEIILGSKSDTFDVQGEITEMSNRKPSLDEIKKVLKEFFGEIDQIPPKFSAVKVKGKRAYQLARKGKEFKLESRKVHISKIDIISFKYPSLKIDVTCSSGTYIRSLANDIGEKLEVGAYLNDLLRTRVGDFVLKDSLHIEDISKKGIENCIIPLSKVFGSYEKIELSSDEYEKLKNGQVIKKSNLKDSIEIFSAFFENKFVGIIKKVPGGIKFKKQLIYD